jgi:hypothetical protein
MRSIALAPLLVGTVAACGANASAPQGARDAGASSPDGSGAPEGTSEAGGVAPDASGGSDAGITEGGATADAGGVTPGQPITATPGQWTFVSFADAFCADGSTTGIGVNPSTSSSRVLIYFEGGGACWDALTCYTLMTAANFTTGYTAATFMTESTDATYLALPGGFFDRTAASNPFKDYSWVYVPYCTGDLHAGDNVVSYPADDGGAHTAHFAGAANFRAFLSRIVATFPNPDRVYLAGSAEGAMGSVIHWGLTQQAFGSARVDVVDDCGAFMPADVPIQDYATQQAAWNLAAALPAGCTGCSTSLAALYPYWAQTLAGHELALVSYSEDTVLPSYYGISASQFTSGLDEVLAQDVVPTATFKSFTDDTSGHVLWFSPTTAVSRVTLAEFLTEMTSDTGWATVP